MSGEGGSIDDCSIEEIIQGLRSLLEAIDAGRVAATAVQRAYLSGAVDTLTAVSNRSGQDPRPRTLPTVVSRPHR